MVRTHAGPFFYVLVVIYIYVITIYISYYMYVFFWLHHPLMVILYHVGKTFFCVAKLSQVTYTLLKEYLFFFTVKSTGSLGASTFYCKLTETVKWKRYCIFTDWYQFICKNLKTIMAYLVC